jgi:hypothetical protein
VHYAAGIVFVALISLVAMPYLVLLTIVLLSGVTIIGSRSGLNAAYGKLYPARMRTSGYGFATGIGRLGGIAAPNCPDGEQAPGDTRSADDHVAVGA